MKKIWLMLFILFPINVLAYSNKLIISGEPIGIEVHSKERCIRNNKVLVIGQYFEYKGMDVAYEVAKRTPYISYKFIGMGNRTSLFLKERTGGGIS